MAYLTDDPIDAHALVERVMRPSDGAYVLFEGVVRNHHEGKAVESIFYDAYRPMAEKEMDAIVREISASYPDVALAVVHRLGHLVVGDSSIAIVASFLPPVAFSICSMTRTSVSESVGKLTEVVAVGLSPLRA